MARGTPENDPDRDAPTTVGTTLDLGRAVRAARRHQGLTIEDVAIQANTGLRVVGEIERGKPTAQVAVVLRVVAAVGLELRVGSA